MCHVNFKVVLFSFFESERNCAHFLGCLSSGQMPMFILLLLFIAINSIASAIKALCLVYKYTVTEVFFGTFVNRATIFRNPRIYINARVAEGGLSASRLDRAHRGRGCRRGRGCSGCVGRRNGHRRGEWTARRARRREAATRQAACGRARECAVRPTSAAPGRE